MITFTSFVGYLFRLLYYKIRGKTKLFFEKVHSDDQAISTVEHSTNILVGFVVIALGGFGVVLLMVIIDKMEGM
jgi:hypothetical protein